MKFSASVTICVFILSFVIPGFSCKRSTPADPENALYYYPEKNVYYDARQANFYYSLDSAKTWDSLRYGGENYGAVLGPKISISDTLGYAWENNEWHRKEYNGNLLNIINARTVFITRRDSTKNVKSTTPPKTRPEVVEEEAPPKKGLKKFFNKIFGKKKKSADDKKQ